jgi:hypothetical protein
MAVAPAGPRPDGVPRRDAGDIWHTAATSTRDATRPNGGPREARGGSATGLGPDTHLIHAADHAQAAPKVDRLQGKA